jgi:CPA2 family monovalent cation:H+ antiporter-2
MNGHLLKNIVFLQGIAVVIVSVIPRLHFSPILGYIIVGIIVGPSGFGLIEKEENIEILAEFGIVFLLFAIGLEFSVGQMLAMRKQVFGLGTAQVFITAIVVYFIGHLAGLDTNTNIVVAGAFTLSSTAIVIKQLTEQSEIRSRHGRSTLGILIFQDIAAIPLLILIPALAVSDADNALSLALGVAFLKGIFVVFVIHIIGKYLLRPLFHEVASANSQELFTLTVLTVALGAAAFTEEMGLSMTLGAFLAGMMLSETEYRHQIEADIRPFQDILLGLFFITVGMLISIEILAQYFWTIVLITLAIIVIKGVIIYAIARLFKKESGVSLRIALSLAQVGEFGLVLMSLAFSFDLLHDEIGNILLTAAVISMSLAPFLIKFNGRIVKFVHKNSYISNHQTIESSISEESKHLNNHVILCGFGRVGQTVERFLYKAHHPFMILDMDIKRVHEAHDAGESVYYGDASKQNILNAAEISKAKVLIITFSDYHSTLKIVKTARLLNKDLPILVRTLDDLHLNEMFEAGATEVIPDNFESSIMLAAHLMLMIGQPANRVLRQTRKIRQDRYKILENFYPGEDDNPMEQHQVMKGIIHSVLVEGSMYAIGKRLKDLNLEQYGVKVEAIKRGHVRGENPSMETCIRDDDYIVLSGLIEDIERAEKYLIAN